MRTILTALAFALAISPALADLEPDYAAAEADGYQPAEWTSGGDMAAMIDRELVRGWIQKTLPGAPYSFDYSVADLNADGFGDVVVALSTPRIRDYPGDGEGAIILVGYKLGRGYVLVGENMAVDVGLRPAGGGGHQVAFIDSVGYRAMGD